MTGATYYDAYWHECRALTGLYGELRQLLTEHIPRDARCLDVGCGDGRTAGLFLSEWASTYVGVDVSRAAVDHARSLELDARVVDDPAALPFADSSFDAVVCLEVLEHLVDPLAAVRDTLRVLRPGGLLVATVPNAVYWRRRLDFALIGRWNPLGDELSIEQPWRDPHLRFFTVPALGRMLDTAGYEAVTVGGHWGGLLVDVPGRNRLRRHPADVDSVRPASRLYRFLEARLPSLLAFRLHAVARRPSET